MMTVQRKNSKDENHHDTYYVCVHFQQFAHQILVGCPKTEYINNNKKRLGFWVSSYRDILDNWVSWYLAFLRGGISFQRCNLCGAFLEKLNMREQEGISFNCGFKCSLAWFTSAAAIVSRLHFLQLPKLYATHFSELKAVRKITSVVIVSVTPALRRIKGWTCGSAKICFWKRNFFLGADNIVDLWTLLFYGG